MARARPAAPPRGPGAPARASRDAARLPRRGSQDEWNLHLGARMFAARAKELGARITHEEFDDGHMDVSYRFDVSLPLLSRAITH